jgi:AcrR family transcriptional regulator
MALKRVKYRRPDGGYSRGDETRDAIIKTALVVFGDQGYEAASTRKLVEPSGASPAAIQYYFGGKAGLYRACVEYIAHHGYEKIANDARGLDDISPDSDRDELIDRLADFFVSQEKTVHNDPEMAKMSLFLARTQVSDGPEIFDIIFKGLNERVLLKFCRVIGAIIGKSEDDPETRLRTSMVIAHMTGMRSHGQITLRFMGWEDFSGIQLEIWQATMHAHLRGMLLADIWVP